MRGYNKNEGQGRRGERRVGDGGGVLNTQVSRALALVQWSTTERRNVPKGNGAFFTQERLQMQNRLAYGGGGLLPVTPLS